MRIILATSEAVPFSKTGGLADVSSALSKAMAQRGHQVSLVTPFYPNAQHANRELVAGAQILPVVLTIPVGHREVQARVRKTTIPGSNVEVFLVDQSNYFDRAGLYGERDQDYRDNCERFVFFSRAVLEIARVFRLEPDVIHANDWQTGLIPALIRVEENASISSKPIASVFTIHNMAFQGQFWHWDMLLTGLDWKYFNWKQMEYFGNLNLLKTGITFADQITTVSPTYAEEIQTPEFGCGLHGVLASRRDVLTGILNGCDVDIWNPAIDPMIPANYSRGTYRSGKEDCKQALQQRFKLPIRADVPLLGMVSRMTSQKGYDLIAESMPHLLNADLQMVFLGTGDAGYQSLLSLIAEKHPDKVGVFIGFDEALSHLVEAGCDIFLMPSQFEPCGLNQMYSLIYGTPPIVRAIGGLADSVIDASPENLAADKATGFLFHEYRSEALMRQINKAIDMYRWREVWDKLVQRGMSQDWSWNRSAVEYERVYERALALQEARPESLLMK